MSIGSFTVYFRMSLIPANTVCENVEKVFFLLLQSRMMPLGLPYYRHDFDSVIFTAARCPPGCRLPTTRENSQKSISHCSWRSNQTHQDFFYFQILIKVRLFTLTHQFGSRAQELESRTSSSDSATSVAFLTHACWQIYKRFFCVCTI